MGITRLDLLAGVAVVEVVEDGLVLLADVVALLNEVAVHAPFVRVEGANVRSAEVEHALRRLDDVDVGDAPQELVFGDPDEELHELVADERPLGVALVALPVGDARAGGGDELQIDVGDLELLAVDDLAAVHELGHRVLGDGEDVWGE